MTETHKTNHHLNDQTVSNADSTHVIDLQQKYTKTNPFKPEKYYAIVRGKQTGIYTSWFECADYVINYSGAKFKSFKNLNDAETYVTMHNTKNKTQHHSKETHNPYITPPPSLTRHTSSPHLLTVATPHADEPVQAVTFTPPIPWASNTHTLPHPTGPNKNTPQKQITTNVTTASFKPGGLYSIKATWLLAH